MIRSGIVRENRYFDSMFLMQVRQRMEREPGVHQAAAVMGTDTNKGLLGRLGFTGPWLSAAGPNDLIVAVEGESSEIIRAVLDRLEEFLTQKVKEREERPRTLAAGLAVLPQANLAVISVPGRFAAREARTALERGLNVFLFSSNVSVEDEIALKSLAHERGLLVMGPDCGTAIIRGMGIGFANVVRRGSIGIVGSSGTGIQEVTCLVHQSGQGVSHAIGTGSRDLSEAVGGVSTWAALGVLEDDPDTKVIVLVSKPPGAKLLATLRARLQKCRKPAVACLLGTGKLDSLWEQVHLVSTLDAAAARAVELVGGRTAVPESPDPTTWAASVVREQAQMSSEQKYVRGIFAGGTFCYEAQHVLEQGGIAVHSNAPLDRRFALDDPMRSVGHTLLDLGDEQFTEGRAHPMIDAALRQERLHMEARDAEVAVILLDFILGYNASPDPVRDLLPAIEQAKRTAADRGGHLSVVASVCGTDGDPQGLQLQVTALEEAGVVVLPSNAQAASYCQMLVGNSR
ncbi:MAG: acyl-CoA synthetase FdrA [Candidatus Bipolaricaulota bacterium]